MPDPAPLLAEMAALAAEHAAALVAPVRAFDIAGHVVNCDVAPEVMGVVNLSRDSWYRESVVPDTNSAVRRGRVLVAQGALLVDIGAESTLAGSTRVPPGDQLAQLLPVVSALAAEGIRTSVETYSPEVAHAVLRHGANVLNVTGIRREDEIYAAAAEHDAAIIMNFVQGANVREVRDVVLGADPIPALIDHFGPRLDRAVAEGVTRIFIDPGLGFYYDNLRDGSERVRYQVTVFLNTFRLRVLGWPVCHALPHAVDYFGDEVRSAEPFFAVLAILGRTGLYRTHEVPRVRAVLATLGAIEPGDIYPT
ncbi:MAG: dihydropteroate synthase [Thermoleophilia bacterium]|nr:dihydropteroate synthase [Thermoleophilia bacterium]